jgi:dolichol-phosphate mannosyltransferase
VLTELHLRVSDALRSTGCRYEIVFVNDGSRDGSGDALDELAACDPAVRVLHFSRNFGHQAAVQAGMADARGDAVVVMDSDLQDDPQAIGQFVQCWQDGFDVVYAVRVGRKEGFLKRKLFSSFYRLLDAVSSVDIPRDAGNFGLVDRRAADCINRLADRDRYYPGLRSWVGFKQIGVVVERGRRHDDNPRVSLWGLVRLAKSAIFSFSAFPLTVFHVIAAMSMCTCLGVSAYVLYHKLFTGMAVAGWASTTIVAAFFGALNALGIGILGEYAIRIYDQVRARPGYIVERVTSHSRPQSTQTDDLLDWLAENVAPADDESRVVAAS